MKKIFALILVLCSPFAQAERFSLPHFKPASVAVADGYLQIRLPYDIDSDLCSNKRTIVIRDTHKYFREYLTIAMTAHVSGKKLAVSIMGPCLTRNSWFQIADVMGLTD
ncbi:hypothetical protein ACSLBF_09600 [Pseudoalteromonas sp. T1lg65]|uniref:hypothetical protein n=1 Tax=Pseudoalteromonas sp. T1lg65 TaxID=2077101 RepID=UPI003F79CEA3